MEAPRRARPGIWNEGSTSTEAGDLWVWQKHTCVARKEAQASGPPALLGPPPHVGAWNWGLLEGPRNLRRETSWLLAAGRCESRQLGHPASAAARGGRVGVDRAGEPLHGLATQTPSSFTCAPHHPWTVGQANSPQPKPLALGIKST